MEEKHEDVQKAIEEAKELVRTRAFMLDLPTDVIFNALQGDKVYVVCNPIISYEDGFPRRNFQIEYFDPIPKVHTIRADPVGDKIVIKMGYDFRVIPIIYPQLIIILDISGDEVVVMDGADH